MPSGDFLIPLNYWHIPDDLSTAISLKEACEIYFYSRNTLIRKIKIGQIQGFKMSRKWYLLPADLKKRKNATATGA
ncbi:helix-turn-helix domain-containing protein [Nostoc sp.]